MDDWELDSNTSWMINNLLWKHAIRMTKSDQTWPNKTADCFMVVNRWGLGLILVSHVQIGHGFRKGTCDFWTWEVVGIGDLPFAGQENVWDVLLVFPHLEPLVGGIDMHWSFTFDTLDDLLNVKTILISQKMASTWPNNACKAPHWDDMSSPLLGHLNSWLADKT